MKRTDLQFVLTVILIVSSCSPEKREQAETPPITPYWAFDHVVWEDSINTQEAVFDLVNGYQKRNIPVGAVIIDSPWSTSYNSFTWDTARYQSPQAMIDYLHDNGIRVIMWMTAIMNKTAKDAPIQKNKHYDWLIENEYVTDGGDTIEWWKGAGIHIDYTNPDAVAWLHGQMDPVMDMGVDGWKVDMGAQYLQDTVNTSKGKMPKPEFRKLYYADMYDYTTNRNPEGIIIARPYSHQGKQASPVSKNPMGWCGDFYGNWEGLKMQIYDIYKSAEMGYGAIGCEVGGYWKTRSDKEQLIRYAQFGAMTACMINGGTNGAFTNHLPWYHDQETEKIYRHAVWLHNALMPYLFSETVRTHLNGGSLIKGVNFDQESHILGHDIFTKAITSPGGEMEFNLPANGQWIDFWTNKTYQPETSISEVYGLDRFPLFIRQGAIIPLIIQNSYAGIGNASLKNKQTVLIYPYEKTSYRYYRPTGTGTDYDIIDITFDNITGALEVNGESNLSYAFIIQNVDKPRETIHGEWEYNAEDRSLTIFKQGKDFSLNTK